MYGPGLKSQGSESRQIDQLEANFAWANQPQALHWRPSRYAPSNRNSRQDIYLDCERDLHRGSDRDRNWRTLDSPLFDSPATVDLSGPTVPCTDSRRNSNPLEPGQETLAARIRLGLAGRNLYRRFG